MSPSWLPRGFRFLSGVPEQARKERIIVAIQAVVDDSGTLGTHPVTVLAGLIAPAVIWADFADRSRAALDKPPKVWRFKMEEAHGRDGAFAALSEKERDDKLHKLARVISRTGFTLIHCTTELAGFKAFVGEKLPKDPLRLNYLKDPYVLPFHLMVLGVAGELLSRGQKYQFEIVFDEDRIFGPRAKHWYQVIRRVTPPEVQAILPAEPRFSADELDTAIQAADMFAWFLRMSASGERHQLEWLIPTLFTVPMSPYSTTFTGNQWRAKFDELYTPSMVDEMVKVYDDLYGP